MSETRQEIGRSLEGRLSPEKLDLLLDSVLAITKQGRGWCKTCKKHVYVDVPDAKAVTAALIDLANQAWGRPDVASMGDEERVMFERVVYLGAGDAADAS